jgi:hypothetical protein
MNPGLTQETKESAKTKANLGGQMSNEEQNNSEGSRAFFDLNLSNWEDLSDQQKKELSQKIYEGFMGRVSKEGTGSKSKDM